MTADREDEDQAVAPGYRVELQDEEAESSSHKCDVAKFKRCDYK
jgi:hypothetical protein